MTARGWGSKADLEVEIEELEERISELVGALDEIAQIITPSTRVTALTDLDLDEIREWLDER